MSNSKTSDDSGNIVEEEKQFCLKFLNLESAEDPYLLLSPIVQWDELTGRSDDTGPNNEMSLGMTESVEDEKTQRLQTSEVFKLEECRRSSFIAVSNRSMG